MSRFNPHFPNATQVFDAADKFKQRCLFDQQSPFLHGQTLWTTEHFQALIDNCVKQPDAGGWRRAPMNRVIVRLCGRPCSCRRPCPPSPAPTSRHTGSTLR